jgi:hypothetical protein
VLVGFGFWPVIVDYWLPVLNFEKKGSETGIGPQKPVLNRFLFFIFFKINNFNLKI